MEIHKSSEDYLEAILILSSKNGYIRTDTDKKIFLTDKGKEVA